MATGRLRVYLGAAPGVGKTFAMLSEGRRRAERGTDVVVGIVEDHGRPRTREAIEGLELVPRRTLQHRGVELTELDVDAVLARAPQVVLVDELAHTNAPGSRHEKRWQDVDELLAAGIDVVTTVNVQHLESLNDVVESITGIAQTETVPDEVVRRADQVDLVDMSPEALQRRLAHGNVYAPERVDAALRNYFRLGNLTALRELALLWLADKVEQGLQDYRRAQGIDGHWETRERVVVALTGGQEGATLIRRAARIASRHSGGVLLAVHVTSSDGLQGADPQRLAEQRALVESLGGSYHVVVGDDVADALLDFARAEDASQLVIGASRRGRFASLFGHGNGQGIVRRSGAIDVHLITHEQVARGRGLPHVGGGLSPRRRLVGALLALVLLPALTLLLDQTRDLLSLSSELLLYLLVVLGAALVGGLLPALLAAVVAALLANWFFTEPLYTLTIARPESLLSLVVFLLVGVAAASVVDLAARRTRQAARATAESAALATLSGDVLRGERTLPALLERSREVFGLEAVELYEGDRQVARAGAPGPAAAQDEIVVADGVRMVLHGPPVAAGDRRVLGAFAAQAAASIERGRLKREASTAAQLARVDRVRSSLLAAVGHDLRTPLSAAKAAVTSLRGSEVHWSAEETAELLATAEESLDSLAGVVSNLLDMSRLREGAMPVHARPIALDELMPLVLRHLPDGGRAVRLDVPEQLPEVVADPGLLERALVNLVANALRHTPPGVPVLVSASAYGDVASLRVVDRGLGIADADKEKVFVAFQRSDDRSSSTAGPGVGLGLAVARGFLEAMGGRVVSEDTPGGGLTMAVELPLDPARRPAATGPEPAGSAR